MKEGLPVSGGSLLANGPEAAGMCMASSKIREHSLPVLQSWQHCAVRDLSVLFLHLLATVVRLAGPGGARSVVAESVLVKHQRLIPNRSRNGHPISVPLIAWAPACALRLGRSSALRSSSNRQRCWACRALARALPARVPAIAFMMIGAAIGRVQTVDTGTGYALLVTLTHPVAFPAFVVLIAAGIWTGSQLTRPPQDWLTRSSSRDDDVPTASEWLW